MKGLHRKKILPMKLERRLMFDASLPVITGQVLWLDADDTATVLDAEGDNAASGAFSGLVSTWRDKSGSNFHVTASAGQTPVYTTGALGGNNVLRFDGINDRMLNTAAPIPGDDVTMFVVFRKTSPTNDREAVFEINTAGTSRNALFINNTTGLPGYYINSTFYNFNAAYVPSTYTMMSIVHDSNTANLFRDGVSGGNFAGTAVRAGTSALYVGDDSTGGDLLTGDIAEFIIYNRDLTADERHDVETYLAGKWGLTITNAAPVIGNNTGATVSQSDPVTITGAMLSATDTDNSEANLYFRITNVSDYGTLSNTNTGMNLGLNDTFTQSDITNGYIRYTHGGTADFSDVFTVTLTDGYANVTGINFNLTITPDNQAPDFSGWTQISSENFESGATGWSNNTTTNGGVYLSNFLGRFSQDGGVQTVHKTYNLSGAGDSVVINFDMYKLDSWDGESFRIFIDDTQVYSIAFTQGAFQTPTDGVNGNVSWTVQELTPFAANFAFGQWNEQIFRYSLTITTSSPTIKLGFSSTLDQGITDESWAIDNVTVYEVDSGGTPGPFNIAEGAANGTVVGQVVARDPDVADTLTYSITGGTGAAIFGINSANGTITLTDAAALDYETTTSYTLVLQVTDNGSPAMTDSVTVTVNVLNLPENNAPTLAAFTPVNVLESAAVNTVIATASGADMNGDTITYSITAGNTDNIFAINSTTGAIRISNISALNYEYDTQYSLTIQARDNGFGNLTATRTLTVNIQNVNEAPTFTIPDGFLALDPYLRYNATTGNFYRFVGTGASYAAAQAAAAASTLNGVAGHIATITSAAENTYVRGLGSGNMWLAASDAAVEGEWRWLAGGAESGQLFSLGAAAQNGYYTNWLAGQPVNAEDSLEMQASGQWNDVNGGTRVYVIEWEGADVLAALGNGPYSIAENPANGQAVGSAHAMDPDAGDTLSYSITGGTGAGIFAINAATGAITVANPAVVNFEDVSSYTLDLRVQDAAGLFATRTVTVNITDANDAPTALDLSGMNVTENTGTGTIVATLSTEDEDAGDVHIYSLLSNPGNAFRIVNNELQVLGNIDYEQTQSIIISLRVDDGNGGTFDRTVVISINDLADTFTPPPSGISSGNQADPTPLPEEETERESILMSTLSGGADAQMQAFYGFGDFTQILREYVGRAVAFITGFIPPQGFVPNNQGGEEATQPQENIASTDSYTNMRQSLAFLAQIEGAQKPGAQNDAAIGDDVQTIDQQFADVMSYHKERQAKLRAALMDG